MTPSAVRTRHGVANSGAPECIFRAGSLIVSVSVDWTPQAYAVMERQAIEDAQYWGGKRLTPVPQFIKGEGAGAYWFPGINELMTTDGVDLITATLVRWPHVRYARWARLGTAVTRPYLGRTAATLRGPAP
jgi:hypothetical protein